MRRGLLWGGVIVAIAVAAFFFVRPAVEDTAGSEDRTLTVAIGTWIGFGKAVIAAEKGFFDGLDVDLRIIDDPNALLGGITSGTLDVAQNSIDQYVLYRTRGIEAELLVLTDISAGGDGIAARAGIEAVGGLAGQRVAFTRGPASEYLLVTALRDAGLAMSDMDALEFDDPGATLSSFVSGNADAIVIWEPFLSSALERDGARVLATSADYLGAVMGVMMASPAASERTAALEAFLDGWTAAEDFLRDNETEAFEVMAKGFNVTPEDLRIMLSGAKLLSRDDNAAYFANGAGKLLTQLDPIAGYWATKLDAERLSPDPAWVSPAARRFFGE